jgi:hypothetical protein
MNLFRRQGRSVGPPNTDEIPAHRLGRASNRRLGSLGGAPRGRRLTNLQRARFMLAMVAIRAGLHRPVATVGRTAGVRIPSASFEKVDNLSVKREAKINTLNN